MHPVSVCHQLSWIAWPKTPIPQTTASGLSGSPTLQMYLRLDRSCFAGICSPAFISILRAVGAVYHIVTLYFSIVEYQRSGLNPASVTTEVIPFDHGPNIP